MKIHVVHLDRTPARLHEFLQANAHLTDLVRFPAIDGLTLDLQAMAHRNEIDPALLEIYTKGAVGNVLSHVALWRQASAATQPMTICDDDTIFNHAFVTTAQTIIDQLPPGWDWISWGWNFDAFMKMDFLPGTTPCTLVPNQKQMRSNTRAFQHQTIQPQAFRLLQAFGTPCYTISPKGARTFIDHCWPIRKMRLTLPMGYFLDNVGIDVMLSMAYPLTDSFVSFPPLVITANDISKSTVQRSAKTEPTDAETKKLDTSATRAHAATETPHPRRPSAPSPHPDLAQQTDSSAASPPTSLRQ
jgi:GR25 family glycosyltransferase involved in LPS biosynthesis